MCVVVCYMAVKKTWPVKKENELTRQFTEMKMIRWICSVKVTDRFICSELRERLGIDNIISDTVT